MTRLLKDMDEPALRFYFSSLMALIGDIRPPDVVGTVVLMVTDDGALEFASMYIQHAKLVGVLRHLADSLESGDYVDHVESGDRP